MKTIKWEMSNLENRAISLKRAVKNKTPLATPTRIKLRVEVIRMDSTIATFTTTLQTTKTATKTCAAAIKVGWMSVLVKVTT
jgi:hypothetical protein